ncbi:NUDIX hydrolase [Actinomadura sp. WMMA1423]|uniref:NUDIX hydrolase n=1 Tax=Actinomadura sp. WMMA1423 TaxID=2591108 RepID=UPI00114650E6|nr:NUDIX hydrolase [Actinomadura sp. WMMA1423]
MPDVVRAAGALLWRDGPEFALIHRPRHDDWSFPKGKIDPGEHALRAAVREVEEETGVVPRLGRRLPTVSYPVGDRTKLVDYWAARPAATSAFTPDHEVDELVWLPAEEAEARLTYRHDAGLLREFLQGPFTSAPMVILRHASAGEKNAWREADELRPLDGTGRADAVALAELLHSYGPLRVVSSTTARCLETVLPYARRVRVPVETEPAFTVGETNPERAVERLLSMAGTPVVVSTHGEIVNELIAGLCRELGEKPPDDPALDKGEFWAAHLADGSLAALERHAPATGS